MATKTVKESQLPARIYTQELALQRLDLNNIIDVLRESGVEGDGISPFDLDRITMPAGDSLTYNIPGEDGPEPVRFIEAFILHSHPARQLYAGPYDVTKPEAPICSSFDGLTGYGKPGGACLRCPLGAFGGNCYPYRFVYLLFPECQMPTLMVLPRTSVTAAKKYLRRLTLSGHLPYSVMTKIGLKKRDRGTGMIATFARGDVLGAEAVAFVRQYVNAFKASLSFPRIASPGADPTTLDVDYAHSGTPGGRFTNEVDGLDFDDDPDVDDIP